MFVLLDIEFGEIEPSKLQGLRGKEREKKERKREREKRTEREKDAL